MSLQRLSFPSEHIHLKLNFTSIRSIDVDDDGGSQLNSSNVFLNVAFMLSPHD
jgi:hypothetical protein